MPADRANIFLALACRLRTEEEGEFSMDKTRSIRIGGSLSTDFRRLLVAAFVAVTLVLGVGAFSGTQANAAVYQAVLDYGDTILAMNLDHGGHLTHGSPVNFSGKAYKIIPYGVSEKDEQIDYPV